VRVDSDTETLMHVGTFRTKPTQRRHEVLACDDNVRRTRHIAAWLSDLVKGYGAQVLCAEALSYPKNITIAAKLALCWGAIATVAHYHGLPIVQCSPKGLKEAVTGDSSARKIAVEMALRHRYPAKLESILVGMPSGQVEHACDALGAIVAAMDSDVVRIARMPRA